MSIKSWTNAAGGTLSWSTGTNWSGSAAPGATDDVTIQDQSTATALTVAFDPASAVVNSLTITAGSSKSTTLKLSPSTSLSVSNGVSLGSASNTNFALISGTGTASTSSTLAVTGGTIGGTGTIQALTGTLLVSGSIVAGGASSTTGIVLSSAGATSLLGLTLTGSGNQVRGLAPASGIIRLDAGSLTVVSSGYVAGTNVGGTSVGSGTVQVNGGTLTINPAVTLSSTGQFAVTSGSLDLEGGGTLAGSGVSLSDVSGVQMSVGGTALATGSKIAFAGSTNGAKLVDNTSGGTGLANATISGFAGSDQVVVTNASGFKVVDATHVAVLNGGGGTIETLNFSGSALTSNVAISGTLLTASAACYLEGTRILTEAGAVAVEDLQIGDLVATVEGPQPIHWIGKRAYLTRLINQHHRDALLPISFSAGSLGDNVPARDLFVSPEHMMMLDGVLVAAHNLVNGTTITRHDDVEVVKYFHIELPQHSVMFAEGAASESYLDTGNRNMFSNVLEYAELGLPVGDTAPCLPIVSEGPALMAIRSQLAARAEALGFGTTQEADLHLVVDGVAVYPTSIERGSYRFDIANATSDIRIVSRSAVPAEVDPACADRRRLGVALAGLSISGDGLALDMLAGEGRLVDGFHAAEGQSRWTNGNAGLPTALLALMAGSFTVELRVTATDLAYPIAARSDVVTLAAARHDMRRQLKAA